MTRSGEALLGKVCKFLYSWQMKYNLVQIYLHSIGGRKEYDGELS